MEYNAHALGNYHGHIMTNSKEALLNSYKTGFRFFEVDIQQTSDGHFVAYHLWSKNDADRLQIPLLQACHLLFCTNIVQSKNIL